MSALLTLMRKTQEAQAVRLGVKIERKFTDAELADSMELLAEAETELYGADHRKLIPFRVTVTTADSTEQISILATDACMANVRAAEIMFSGFDCEKPMAFKIKVEPIQTNELRRAA